MVTRDKALNYLVVVLLFVITIKTSISFLVAFFILLLWILGGNFKEKFHTIMHDKLSQTFLALFFIHLLGMLWTESYVEGAKILSKQKIYLFAPLLISFVDKRFAKYALWSFLAAMFLSEWYSLYLYLRDEIHTIGSLPSPFMHHMHYSLILAFTFGYLINEIEFKQFTKPINLFYLFFALLTLVVLFINKGRIGQVSILLVLFILAIGKFRLSFFKSILTVTMLSGIIFFSAYNLSDNFKDRLERANNEFTNFVGTDKRDSIVCRFEMWHYASTLGKQNPLIGIGTGDSMQEMTSLLGEHEFKKLYYECGLGMKYQFNPHNNFVLYFMQFGLLGLVLLIVVLLLQFKIAYAQKSLSMILLLAVTFMGMMTASPITMHIGYMFFYAFVLTILYVDSIDKNPNLTSSP